MTVFAQPLVDVHRLYLGLRAQARPYHSSTGENAGGEEYFHEKLESHSSSPVWSSIVLCLKWGLAVKNQLLYVNYALVLVIKMFTYKSWAFV